MYKTLGGQLTLFWIAALPSIVAANEFVLRSPCPGSAMRFCLVQEISLNRSVVLLGSEQSATCRTRGTQHLEYPTDGATVRSIITTLLEDHVCPNFKFNIAYLGSDHPTYSLEKLDTVADTSIVAIIDRSARESATEIERQGGEHPAKLPSSAPIVYSVPGLDEAYIGVYENAAPSGDQIHVLYLRGKLSLIARAARVHSTFRLNDTFFIHYKFSCKIGCGYFGDLIFSITDDGATRVLLDDSWST